MKFLIAVSSLALLLHSASAYSNIDDLRFLEESDSEDSLSLENLGEDSFVQKNIQLEDSLEKELRSSVFSYKYPQPVQDERIIYERDFTEDLEQREALGYPLEEIQRALAQTPLITELLGSEPEEGVSPERSVTCDKSRDFCETKPVIWFPVVLPNIRNEPKWIIQEKLCPSKLKSCLQGIKKVTCLKEKERCSYSEYFPQGSSSFCEQQYTYKKLYTYDNTSSNPISMDLFKIPCGCSCKLVLGDPSTAGIARSAARISDSPSKQLKLNDYGFLNKLIQFNLKPWDEDTKTNYRSPSRAYRQPPFY